MQLWNIPDPRESFASRFAEVEMKDSRSFTRAFFRAVFDPRSPFFTPKPHGDARYAGYP